MGEMWDNQKPGPKPKSEVDCVGVHDFVLLDQQVVHDAELMLWSFMHCIDKGIIPTESGWLRELVAQTRQRLADANTVTLTERESTP